MKNSIIKKNLRTYQDRTKREEEIDKLNLNNDEKEILKKQTIKKPSVFLVYLVLKNYSSIDNCLSREKIIEHVKKDYGVILSKNTITNCIKEIGDINNEILESQDFDKNKPVVITNGKKGYFLLDSGSLNIGEVFLFVELIKESESLTNKDKNEMISKILKSSISNKNYDDIGKLKDEFSDNFLKSEDSKFKQIISDSTDKLTLISRAKLLNRDIIFEHQIGLKNIKESDKNLVKKHKTKRITMTPYLIFQNNNEIYVLGSAAKEVDETSLKENNDKKYVLYISKLINMENIKILSDDDVSTTPWSESFEIEDLKKYLIFSKNDIEEGIFNPEDLKVNAYEITYQEEDFFIEILNYFKNGIYQNDSRAKKCILFATEEAIINFYYKYSFKLNKNLEIKPIELSMPLEESSFINCSSNDNLKKFSKKVYQDFYKGSNSCMTEKDDYMNPILYLMSYQETIEEFKKVNYETLVKLYEHENPKPFEVVLTNKLNFDFTMRSKMASEIIKDFKNFNLKFMRGTMNSYSLNKYNKSLLEDKETWINCLADVLHICCFGYFVHEIMKDEELIKYDAFNPDQIRYPYDYYSFYYPINLAKEDIGESYEDYRYFQFMGFEINLIPAEHIVNYILKYYYRYRIKWWTKNCLVDFYDYFIGLH